MRSIAKRHSGLATLVLLAILLGWLPAAAQETQPAERAGEPTLYATVLGKLDALPEPWRPIEVLYAHTGILDPPKSFQTPSVEHVKTQLAETADKPIVLDFEHGGTAGRVKRLGVIAGTACRIQQVAPKRMVGCYGQLPTRNYWGAVNDKVEQWQAKNDEAAAVIGPHVNALFPSLYIFYDLQQSGNLERAYTYIDANLDEAQRFGKPVYPFVWPQYHQGGNVKGRLIEPELWARLINRILEHPATAGLVFWGHAGTPELTRLYLDIAAREAGYKIVVAKPEQR